MNARETKIRLEREEKEARLKSVESRTVEIKEKALYIGIDCEMVRQLARVSRSSLFASLSFFHHYEYGIGGCWRWRHKECSGKGHHGRF